MITPPQRHPRRDRSAPRLTPSLYCSLDQVGCHARPELGSEAVPVLVEDEEGMVADGLEVAVVGRVLLPAVNGTLGAVDIEGHAPRGRQGGVVLQQVSIEAREPLIVPLLSEDVRFEPVQRVVTRRGPVAASVSGSRLT